MQYPKIPINPFTLMFNGKLIASYLKYFMATYLPDLEWIETSGYRTPAKNEEEGGAKYSAHMYNLAKDGVLQSRITGKILDDLQMKETFNKIIKPKWEGFGQWEPKKPGDKTGHIHLNISRDFSKYTKYVGALAVFAAGAFGIKHLIKGRGHGR